jgi:hypothetical protein
MLGLDVVSRIKKKILTTNLAVEIFKFSNRFESGRKASYAKWLGKAGEYFFE